MVSLGSKIKMKRKQLKLTLKELAGDDISYSMLSQIENDKAKPSLDTLNIIASKLGLQISELVNTIEIEEFRSILKEAEKLTVMPFERNIQTDFKIVEKIEPLLKDLPEETYEAARLIELYVRSNYYISGELKEELLAKTVKYYEHAGMIAPKLKATLFKSKCLYNHLNYVQAFKELEWILQEVEQAEFLVDQVTLSEIYYYSSTLHAALGNFKEALQFLQKCLSISQAHSLYTKTDAVYRLLVILYLQQGDEHYATEMLNKLYKYIDFTQNIYEEANYYYLKFHYDNRTQKDAKEVEQNIRLFIDKSKSNEGFTLSTLFNQELAYTLWAQQKFEDALELLKNMQIPEYIKHPLDLSACYEIFAIRALCQLELGNLEEAIEDIVFSNQQIKSLPNTLYKDFVKRAYKKIISRD